MRFIRTTAFAILVLAMGSLNPGWAEPPKEDHFAIFTASNNDYIRLVAEADVDGLMKHYASDAIQMPPGAPTIHGADKIRESWKAYFAEFEVLEAASYIDGVVVTGDRAFAYGHYTTTARAKSEGAIYHESGRFAESDRQLEDGTWVMEVEIWNYDRAAGKDD